MKVREGIHTYDLDWTEGEPLSVHVVETNDANVLFGGGDEFTADELLAIARKHNVEVLIVEHGDVDHYEGAKLLADQLDLTIAVPEGDEHFLTDAGIEVDIPLEADREYWEILTISAPGHTPDNMAYLYEDTIIAGDTVVGSDSVFAADIEWDGELAVITPDWNFDDEQMKSSVANLLQYDFESVLVTHGSNVYESGKKELQHLVETLKEQS